jgi:hypothetical protein
MGRQKNLLFMKINNQVAYETEEGIFFKKMSNLVEQLQKKTICEIFWIAIVM